MRRLHKTWLKWLVTLCLACCTQWVVAADWLYSMRPGDTLWSVCKTYTKEANCWQQLGPLNQIDRDRTIPPGTRIRIPASWLKVPAASVKIDFSHGDVQFQRPGEAPTAAQAGVELPIGTKLKTRDGTVTLRFADDSTMLLEPDSELELDSLSNFELNGMVDSTVRLHQGTVKTRVIKREPRSRFFTITPSAVAAVRGTEYRVSIADVSRPAHQGKQDETSRVEVYQGLVDVAADATRFPVPESYGIVAKAGDPLEPPVRLLDAPLFKKIPARFMVSTDPFSAEKQALEISWDAMPGASAYQLSIYQDQQNQDSSEQLIKTVRTIALSENINALETGCYRLGLRAIDGLGLHGLAAKSRTCLEDAPEGPALQSALPDNSDTHQHLLAWPAIESADQYLIQIAEDADFQHLIRSEVTVEPKYILESPDSPQYVRVQALKDNAILSNPGPALIIPARPPIEDNDQWKMLIPVGLFILAII